jgi:predicted PurR-regulated permease PerM
VDIRNLSLTLLAVIAGLAVLYVAQVVFIPIVWGWIWGLWGLLLAVPLMLALKAVCDRVEDLKPLAELMGE